ncbi:TetR/AcrR family transcriptional regulator [Quisquiliibacterium transsilvanicum]|uniref:AcrR family transcriptional regulator n=1 Tax=Quisquiliibacterium transsilvanicum TaxID=1549638 RepID=A0A7W8M873_9BURK|nr:TetR/AcrR family transcriptional regulator [Quisquiliibacterium transsilvanicum]MBB5271721.1 AcrR family transcriptional regulator [Quisquiliibacterium transsilvanicum]
MSEPAIQRQERGGGSIPRERILHAAARLFRERGYQRTTVRDIAERVGILSGSLFHHFRSKEEMLLEIMREAAIAVCLKAEDIVLRQQGAAQRLRALISLELDCVVGDPSSDYHAVQFTEWREVPESARPEFRMLRRRYAGVWLAVLEDCERQGLLRCEPLAALHVLHGAMVGAMTWFRPSGRYSVGQYADILAQLVLQGDGAPAPGAGAPRTGDRAGDGTGDEAGAGA